MPERETSSWQPKAILLAFKKALELIFNFQKSKILCIGMEDEEASNLATMMNCKKGSLLFTYLGLPLYGKKIRNAFVAITGKNQLQTSDMEREASFLGWQNDGLSIILRWVVSRIDHMRQTFLWKGNENANGFHCLVTRNSICHSKVHFINSLCYFYSICTPSALVKKVSFFFFKLSRACELKTYSTSPMSTLFEVSKRFDDWELWFTTFWDD